MERSNKFTVYIVSTIMLIIALGSSFGLGAWRIREIAADNGLRAVMKDIQNILEFMAVFDASILLAYLAWVIRIVRRENIRNTRELKYKTYLYEVQKELFDFHRSTESMTDALKKTGEMLTATGMFLCILEEDEIEETYLWGDRKLKEEVVKNILTVTGKRLAEGESILVDLRNPKNAIPEWDFSTMRRRHILNAMLVPLRDTSGRMMGVVGAVNMKQRWKDTTRLDETSWNFGMALINLETHKIIRKMGTVDTMTGLKNRNCYEQGIVDYIGRAEGKEESLCCIYMDVNGLHELNNTFGHSAGDEMLKYIGETVRQLFGSTSTYRIGGDEFVIFCQGSTKEEVGNKIRQMEELLQEKRYRVSIGESWNDEKIGLRKQIAMAERQMYAAKQEYYESLGEPDKIRNYRDYLDSLSAIC